jgi:hypothetical protein
MIEQLSRGYPDPTAKEAIANVMREGETERRRFRPLVYICSPYAGDVVGNTSRALTYCRFAVAKGCIPLAPHLHYPRFMDDGDADERALGLSFALVLLCKCAEIWVFGDRISDGMATEIAKAIKRKMPIRYFGEQCEEVVT